jgi:hypothetical protein
MIIKTFKSLFIGVIALIFMVNMTNGISNEANTVKKHFEKISIKKFEDIFKKYKK